MVLIIIATLLVLGFAFYQTTQGMFSAMIMAILTVLCSAAALNYYEPLAGIFISKGWLGAYAHGVCMLALFVVPLLALREIFDRVIPGNVVMGMWTDRVGGAAFGLITAFVLVGMLMIVVQLLPLPGSIVTYQPYTATLEENHGLTPRWAGQFALWLGKGLSATGLSPVGGGQSLGLCHDDLLLDTFCVRNRPSGAWAGTPADALEVTDVYEVRMPDKEKLLKQLKLRPEEIVRLGANVAAVENDAPKYPLLPPLANTKLYVIRVTVKETARDGADNWYRLPATHFRLVTEKGHSFYPVGYLAFAGRYRVETVIPKRSKIKVAQIADILVARAWQAEGGPERLLVDWLYRLPPEEVPEYMAFRRVARDDLPPVGVGLPSPLDAKGNLRALHVKPVDPRREGSAPFESVGGARFIRPTSMRRDNEIPKELQAQVGTGGVAPPILKNVVHTKSMFHSGVLAGAASDLFSPEKMSYRVRQYETPSAEIESRGRKTSVAMPVVQVECELDKGFGGNLPALIDSLNPQLILDNGVSRPHSGAYLIYSTNAGRQVYLYYAPTFDRTRLDAGFAEALRGHLARVEKIGFVFIVPADRDRGVAGIAFTPDGANDVFAPDPLACYYGR
ncbi:MAG: hypothetical protein AMJ81_06840 [Phycisphaerae bacterium SM23_33]|nr:MAG: hypothetical protein AMJ81_06840 [Phycisphaerae bacterium SM23_33]